MRINRGNLTYSVMSLSDFGIHKHCDMIRIILFIFFFFFQVGKYLFIFEYHLDIKNQRNTNITFSIHYYNIFVKLHFSKIV